MADSVTVQLVDRATVRLKAIPENVRAKLRAVIVRDGKELASLVRGKLSGSVLKVRSGKLLNSIRTEMVENANTIYGRVYSKGVPYAAIHEYGGQTKPHDIYPKNVKALHFMVGGASVFAGMVHHPGSKIPERSYLRSSLAEMKSALIADITKAGSPEWD